MSKYRKLTQDELLAEAKQRFGDDPLKWAFRCPSCHDVATAQDFKDAGANPNSIGQECIGMSLGALSAEHRAGRKKYTGRGCDWCAYGLFRGPWIVTTPDGREIGSFPLADAPAAEESAA